MCFYIKPINKRSFGSKAAHHKNIRKMNLHKSHASSPHGTDKPRKHKEGQVHCFPCPCDSVLLSRAHTKSTLMYLPLAITIGSHHLFVRVRKVHACLYHSLSSNHIQKATIYFLVTFISFKSKFYFFIENGLQLLLDLLPEAQKKNYVKYYVI